MPSIFLFFFSLFLLDGVAGQIRILQPAELAARFHFGVLKGSTAGFGTPYWGEALSGVIVYGESRGNAHCTHEDYDLPAAIPNPGNTADENSSSNSTVAEDSPPSVYPRIALIRRGKCHFSQKILVAQEKGAAAVIVVDEEGSKRTPQDIRGVIMADDGMGTTIRIPSVLISDAEGSHIIDAVRRDRRVIAELTWDMPNEFIVEVDQWLSPSISASLNFLSSFAPFAQQLKHLINYRPHFWIFSMPTDSGKMCRDLNGKFCSLTPDWHDDGLTGSQMVEEAVRQRCLWEMTSTTSNTLPRSGEYSAAWWQYVAAVDNACLRPPQNSTQWAQRATAECSYNLIKTLDGVDIMEIDACVKNYGESYLIGDLYSHAWSPTALMINDARFAGPLDSFVVARAICTGFIKEPEECKTLKSQNIHDVVYHQRGSNDGYVLGDGFGGTRRRGGIAWWIYFLSIASCFGVFGGAVIFYRIWLVKKLRDELRYEVFEEVQSQMKQRTTPLRGDGGAASRSFEVDA